MSLSWTSLKELPDGTHFLPMVLDGGSHHFRLGASTVARECEIQPETATWALAHAIYPSEVFDPADPLVRDFLHLLDLRDDEEHVPATTGWLPVALASPSHCPSPKAPSRRCRCGV
jgi:hypothetical protein